MKKVFETTSPAETENIGAALAALLTPGTVIAYTADQAEKLKNAQ